MNKKKWEIWTCDFPGKGAHPVVLISHPDRCRGGELLNVLYCTSQRQARSASEREILLDRADGLDWETFCRCDLIYTVPANALFDQRGKVSLERRRQIRRKLISIFGLLDTD
jgi:mRNA-degrading endonuclease toxin of MazEF toxin-antitoxin module